MKIVNSTDRFTNLTVNRLAAVSTNLEKIFSQEANINTLTVTDSASFKDLTVDGLAFLSELTVSDTSNLSGCVIHGLASLFDLTAAGHSTFNDCDINGLMTTSDVTVNGTLTSENMNCHGLTNSEGGNTYTVVGIDESLTLSKSESAKLLLISNATPNPIAITLPPVAGSEGVHYQFCVNDILGDIVIASAPGDTMKGVVTAGANPPSSVSAATTLTINAAQSTPGDCVEAWSLGPFTPEWGLRRTTFAQSGGILWT